MALSDAWLKANSNKARPALAKFSDCDGLGVRVTPKGKIVFQLRYRYDGKHKRADLGSYLALNLKAARSESQRLKAQLEQGHNPKIVRALEKQHIPRSLNVSVQTGQVQLQMTFPVKEYEDVVSEYSDKVA